MVLNQCNFRRRDIATNSERIAHWSNVIKLVLKLTGYSGLIKKKKKLGGPQVAYGDEENEMMTKSRPGARGAYHWRRTRATVAASGVSAARTRLRSGLGDSGTGSRVPRVAVVPRSHKSSITRRAAPYTVVTRTSVSERARTCVFTIISPTGDGTRLPAAAAAEVNRFRTRRLCETAGGGGSRRWHSTSRGFKYKSCAPGVRSHQSSSSFSSSRTTRANNHNFSSHSTPKTQTTAIMQFTVSIRGTRSLFVNAHGLIWLVVISVFVFGFFFFFISFFPLSHRCWSLSLS